MALPLAQRHADHHARRLEFPTLAAGDRDQCLQRHLVIADHHPPRRGGAIGEIEPRAFIDDPAAQRRLGRLDTARIDALDMIERHQPVGQSRGRHIAERHGKLVDHPRRRGIVARERSQGRQPQQAGIAMAHPFLGQAPVDDLAQRIDQPGLGRLGPREPGVGGYRQGIGRQRDRSALVRIGPIMEQAIFRDIGRQIGHLLRPRRAIVERYCLRQPLFEATVRVSEHIGPHPGERRHRRVHQSHIDPAAPGQGARRRCDRNRRTRPDPDERRRPHLFGDRRDHLLIDRDPIVRAPVRRSCGHRPVKRIDMRRRGQIPGHRHRAGACRYASLDGDRTIGGRARERSGRGR